MFSPTKYKLESLACDAIFEDKNWVLDCPTCDKPAFIRADYEQKQLKVKDESLGLYKFSDWLPVHRMLAGSAAPITYKSEGLANAIGLENLWITFNGWWPEKKALMKTASFKETEAYSVCGRLEKDAKGVLVVASAGNTARAFAHVCSQNNIPLLLSVPEDNIGALWFEKPLNDCVKLISIEKGGDYFDAIHLSNLVCKIDGFFPEGGAKNVARRDGMATTVLSAVTTIGKIPDYYFQAVGSGTGAIAAWEANLRFIKDGRFGDNKMKLMVSQNAPFTLIYDAWKAKSRELLPLDNDVARKQVETIDAKVLSNRKPPYSIMGGLFDAMSDAGGDVLLATNQEARAAAKLFLDSEKNDIHPAAACAVHTLIDSVKKGIVKKSDCVMLNITGGGEERFKNENDVWYLKPDIVFPIDSDLDFIETKVKELF